VILSRGSVLHIPSTDLKSRIPEAGDTNGFVTLEEMEKKHILSVLEQTHWVFGGPNGAAAVFGDQKTHPPISYAKAGDLSSTTPDHVRTPTHSN